MKIDSSIKNKIKRIFFVTLCLSVVTWWFLSGINTQYKCVIIVRNTEYVLSDNTKLGIEYINSSNMIFLEDFSSIEGDNVDEYIPVVKGTGIYYIPDNLMTRELNYSESIGLGRIFVILCISVFILMHIVSWKTKKYRLLTVVWLLMCIFMWVIVAYWVENILLGSFPVGIIIFMCFVEFIMYIIILNNKNKRVR